MSNEFDSIFGANRGRTAAGQKLARVSVPRGVISDEFYARYAFSMLAMQEQTIPEELGNWRVIASSSKGAFKYGTLRYDLAVDVTGQIAIISDWRLQSLADERNAVHLTRDTTGFSIILEACNSINSVLDKQNRTVPRKKRRDIKPLTPKRVAKQFRKSVKCLAPEDVVIAAKAEQNF